MRPAALLPVLAVVIAGSLLAAGAAPATNQPSTVYVDRNGGYRITVPRAWQVIPPSLTVVQQTIARLKKQKKTDLAAAYSTYISTPAARRELATYRFRAFMWPAGGSLVPTDVTLTIQPIPKGVKDRDLPNIGAYFAKAMHVPGATVEQPQLLQLPAGKAVEISSTLPLPKPNQALKTAYSLVILVRPRKLFMLQFRIDSRVANQALVFPAIAKLFRFCPARGSCT